MNRRRMTLHPHSARALATLCALALSACAETGSQGDSAPEIAAVAPQRVTVGATLRVDMAADNPSGAALRWDVAPPALPSIGTTVGIYGTPAGAELRYTPLASHVGTHAFVVTAVGSAGRDEEEVVVTVEPSAAGAPFFLAPGAGGVFAVDRSGGCVEFRAEVRDDDSTDVALALESGPEGASLAQTGPKSASVTWCLAGAPPADGARGTFVLSATDAIHPPVTHTFTALLRVEEPSTPDPCTGTPPAVAITSPDKGTSVLASDGVRVVVSASDEESFAHEPTVFWTTGDVDPDAYDLARFAATESVWVSGDTFEAALPIALDAGAEVTVWVVARATDDDDAGGSECDGEGTSELIRFTALGDDVVIPDPDPDPPCVEDALEDDDGFSEARVFEDWGGSEGVVCDGDEDWILFDVPSAGWVSVDLLFDYGATDLDLEVYDDTELLVASSAGLADEFVSFYAEADALFFARVYGYLGASGPWVLLIGHEQDDL